MGIALWLIPIEGATKALETLMSVRPQGSKASYPKIIPHITLATLPNAPAEPLKHIIPALDEPIHAQFERLCVGDVYFRSVYIAITLTEDLEKIHSHIHDQLGLQAKTPSFPHISLAYIDDSNAEEREKFVQELKDQGLTRDRDDGAQFKHKEKGLWLGGADIAQVWLVDCNGPVESWKVLEKHDLSI